MHHLGHIFLNKMKTPFFNDSDLVNFTLLAYGFKKDDLDCLGFPYQFARNEMRFYAGFPLLPIREKPSEPFICDEFHAWSQSKATSLLLQSQRSWIDTNILKLSA